MSEIQLDTKCRKCLAVRIKPITNFKFVFSHHCELENWCEFQFSVFVLSQKMENMIEIRFSTSKLKMKIEWLKRTRTIYLRKALF